MRNPRSLGIAIFGALLLLGLLVSPGVADTPQEQVSAKLDKLDDWLGSSKNAQDWRKYLLMEDLRAQLEKGWEADAETVSAVLAKYARDHKGLKRSRFIAVRNALESWLLDLRYSDINDLTAAVGGAKGQFVPLDESAVDIERARLKSNLGKLARYLTQFRRLASWKKYLNWGELETQLAAEDGGDIKVLQEIGGKFRGDHSGLELPAFVAVRESLLRYMTTSYFTSTPDLEKSFETQLGLLEKHLAAYQEKPTTDDASAIGRLVGWLKSAHQAEDVVQGIQHHLLQPNLYARISRDLISEGVDRKIDDKRKVSTRVGGARVSGNAFTKANVSARFVPNSSRAEIELRLSGIVNSKTVARSGSVSVYARGITDVDAHKVIYIDSTGIHSKPADAICKTKTRVTGLSAPPLIEGVAWSRVNSQKRSGERQAARDTERQFEKQMDTNAGKMVAKGDKRFNDSIRKPLIRRRAFPRLIQFSTTEDTLLVTATQGNDFQIAASSAPPEIPDGFDMSVQVHQSILGNLSESYVGGDTLHGDYLAAIFEQLTGETPKELESGDWSIKFSAIQPISLQFGDGTVRIAVRGSRFTSGETTIKRSMEFAATYQVQRSGNGSKAVRQGEVEARYLKGGKESIRENTVKTVIRKKFGAMFKDSIESDGLELPGKWAELGKMHLQHLECKDGWLSYGWDLVQVRTAEKPSTE